MGHIEYPIYIQKAEHFAKGKTICVTFLFTKSPTLYVTRFSWHFWYLHLYIYKKHDTLPYVTFLYTKSLTLCVTRFSWNFWNWQREGAFLGTKNNALCVEFLYAKNDALSVTFLYTKSPTLCLTFLYFKNNALCVTFLYLNFIAYDILISKNKRTYNQIDQIDK